MARLEEMWARLQPGMRKGDVRSIEAGIRVMERKARLLGLDMPTKVAMTDPDGQGIPLETIRRVMERVDRQRAEVDVTPVPAPLLLDHKKQ
jgi:hypothetical protein